MGKKVCEFMHGWFSILWCMAVLLSAMFPAKALLAGQEQVDCPPLAGALGVDTCSLSEAHPTEICKLLTSKTASEKAQIKSREIAKRDFKGEYTNTQYGVRVEIIGEVKEININGQSGIELFAKAWRGDKQLGFGKDGSVEIERFRIYNPPILVDDPKGDILREWTDKETGLLKQRKLREDPLQAIKEVIAHNVTLVGKDNGKIVIGKVGNTTSTFYPDAHPESTSHDAMMASYTRSSWATAHDDTEAQYINDNYAGPDRFVYSGKDGANFKIVRFQTLFDTSPIGSDTVSSATASLYVNLVNNGDNDGDDYIAVVSSNPASNTGMALGDYSLMGTTAYSNTIDLSSMSTGGYVDWTINATGLVAINTSGITKFGFREGHDIINSAYAGADDTVNSIVTYAAEQAGTTNDPKLVVVHSAPTSVASNWTYDTDFESGEGYSTGDLEGQDSWTLNVGASGSFQVQNSVVANGSQAVSATASSTENRGVERTITATSKGNVKIFMRASKTSGAGSIARFVQSGGTGRFEVHLKQGSNQIMIRGSSDTNLQEYSANTWYEIEIEYDTVADTFRVRVDGGSWSANESMAGTSGNTIVGIRLQINDDVLGGFGTYYFDTLARTDTTAPSGSISINSGASYTNSTTVTLNLSATDDVGVTGYYVSDGSTPPSASASGWTSVTSTTSYSGSVSYSLSTGDGSKTIYAWYKDAAENVSSTANATITLDTTVPTVTISSPTSNSTYTATSSTISLGGSASDSLSGISSVTWNNSKGGSGTASGTASWTISVINLSSGDNTITVTATDGAGNPGTDIITVTVTTPPTPTPSPIPTQTPTLTPTPSPTTTPTPGIIVGAVVDALAVVPISGATVSTDRGGYAATTDATGAYLMSNVSPGNYVLTASATGFEPRTQSITIEAGVTVVVDFALIPVLPTTLTPLPTPSVSPGIVYGSVQDEDENPLRGVTVTIEGNNFSDNTETNEDGFFTFENVLSANYTLTFEEEGYETQTKKITLGEGEVKDLGTITLEVEPISEIYGYVVNIKDNPIEFVRLKLKGIKTKVKKTASSDEDGFFEFTDLKADTYIIFAKKKKYRNTQRKVKLGDSESKEIEIVMKKTSKRVREMMEDGQ